MEHIENLTSKQGGDNEAYFQDPEKGDKAEPETAGCENDLTDSGLRL